MLLLLLQKSGGGGGGRNVEFNFVECGLFITKKNVSGKQVALLQLFFQVCVKILTWHIKHKGKM